MSPKPYNQRLVKVAWGDDVHPNIPQYWRNLRNNRNSPMSEHPVLGEHGEALARESYETTKAGMRQHNARINDMMQVLSQIDQLERPHKDQLAQLAAQLVSQKYGIPQQRLKPKSTNLDELQNGGGGEEQDGEGGDPPVEINNAHEHFDEMLGEGANRPIAGDDRPELNKRLTFNLIKQGASMVDLLNAHNDVAQQLNAINPRLLPLYNKLAHATHAAYYMMDTSNATPEQLAGTAGASEHLEEDEGEAGAEGAQPGEQGDQQQQPRQLNVVAKGPCFPFIVHELTKGSFELLGHMYHSETLDDETANFIRKHADDIRLEPWLLQSGPAFWKKFTTALQGMQGAPSVSHVLAYLMSAPPTMVNNLAKQIAVNPEQARPALQQFITQSIERAQQENAPPEEAAGEIGMEGQQPEPEGFQGYDPEAGLAAEQNGQNNEFNDFGEFGQDDNGDGDWFPGPGR